MNDMTAVNPRLRLASHIRYREVNGEGIILDQRAAHMIVVNALGERILQLLRNLITFQEIIMQLHEEYDVNDDTLTEDVQSYLSQLESAGVIEHIGIDDTPNRTGQQE